MKYLKITLAIYAILLLITPSRQPATPAPQEPVIQKTLNEQLAEATLDERRDILKEHIQVLGATYSIDSKKMYSTIALCENIPIDPKQQSKHIYYFNSPKRGIVEGDRERSYGLAMIHLPDHKNITYEQATDAEFALDWMAREFKAGRQSQWTCYRKLFQV